MKIVVTGAGGRVGRILRPILASRYEQVILTDIQDIGDTASNETFLRGDIQDAAFTDQLLSGADGLVHLAGLVGPDFTYLETMGANVNGTYNLLNAAVKNGVTKIVYASSHHAVGFYKRDVEVGTDNNFRADSFYGVSKAFGEILTQYFADRHGISGLNIRIGNADDVIRDERRLHIWTSARDLAQLVDIGLKSNKPGCKTVYGISKVPGRFFDNSEALDLGYEPQDNSIDFAENESLLAGLEGASARDGFIGGHFCESKEF